MTIKKPTNPIYVAALPVGVLFAITACAYIVMTMQGLDPQRAESTGLIQWMEQHGMAILAGELIVLGIMTLTAIATDDFWTRRFEASRDARLDD
jgi:hypothetical protein